MSGSRRAGQVEEAVTELAEEPEDEATLNLVRTLVQKVLTEEPDLAAQTAKVLAEAGVTDGSYMVQISGGQNQVGSHNVQHNYGVPPR